jgi:hypothetical protein
VPFQPSRQPSSAWSDLFVKAWDRPPQFTNMHRPGIASISGNRILLNGTTIEEVEQYHRNTLLIVIERVNQLIAEQERKEQERIETEQRRLKEHEDAVRAAAHRIKFE